MRIAYDYQIFSSQAYGGVSRYFCSLIEHLSKVEQVDDVAIVAPFYINTYLKASLPSKYVKGLYIPPIPNASYVLRMASFFLSQAKIKAFQPDILHETYYSLKTYPVGKITRVVTVYDMIHEKFSSLMSDNTQKIILAKKAAVERADFVICISENTRKDLLDLLDVPEDKTATVHLGYDVLTSQSKNSTFGDQNSIAPKRIKPYILYVGVRGGYKNFENLLRAYAYSSWLKRDFNLVCFGGGGVKPDEKKLISELGISYGQVIHVAGNDYELIKAYQGATAFIYPSLYEGFGIPPLEAMSFGCPVICSNTSSIPEVVDNAGEYFNPAVPEDISASIERVLSSTERCYELIELGKKRYIQFSWEKCAQTTLDIYQKLL